MFSSWAFWSRSVSSVESADPGWRLDSSRTKKRMRLQETNTSERCEPLAFSGYYARSDVDHGILDFARDFSFFLSSPCTFWAVVLVSWILVAWPSSRLIRLDRHLIRLGRSGYTNLPRSTYATCFALSVDFSSSFDMESSFFSNSLLLYPFILSFRVIGLGYLRSTFLSVS